MRLRCPGLCIVRWALGERQALRWPFSVPRTEPGCRESGTFGSVLTSELGGRAHLLFPVESWAPTFLSVIFVLILPTGWTNRSVGRAASKVGRA